MRQTSARAPRPRHRRAFPRYDGRYPVGWLELYRRARGCPGERATLRGGPSGGFAALRYSAATHGEPVAVAAENGRELAWFAARFGRRVGLAEVLRAPCPRPACARYLAQRTSLREALALWPALDDAPLKLWLLRRYQLRDLLTWRETVGAFLACGPGFWPARIAAYAREFRLGAHELATVATFAQVQLGDRGRPLSVHLAELAGGMPRKRRRDSPL
jgi:hypothetical protein